MKSVRILLLLEESPLRDAMELSFNKRVSVVIPDKNHTPKECLKDGSFSAILLSFDMAARYRDSIVNVTAKMPVPAERILVYDATQWEDIAPLVEQGVVTRLVPRSWDLSTLVELILHFCAAQELQHQLSHAHHHLEETDADNPDILKQKMRALVAQNRRLQSLATTDGLTGLTNRREFNETLIREVSRARRFKQPLSLIMLDVDFFKHYNDSFGHPAGDEVLKMLASLIRDRLRQSDHAARYGGEEFVLVLPMTTLDAAVKVADSLRQKVAEYRFANEDMQPGGDLTISLGVASLEEGGDGTTLTDAADKALYHAKHSGRNRVGSSFNGVLEIPPV